MRAVLTVERAQHAASVKACESMLNQSAINASKDRIYREVQRLERDYQRFNNEINASSLLRSVSTPRSRKDLKMLGQIETMKAIDLGRSGPTGTRQPPKQIDPL
jgi:hypothetical protein